jgi:soluble lytic murein transglycosylase
MHSLLFRTAVCVISIASLQPLGAAESVAPEVRLEFVQAYRFTDSNPEQHDSAALRSYLLYPYVQRARLQQRISNDVNASSDLDRAVASFLDTHETRPVTRTLRIQWYASLAKRKQWPTLVTYYRPSNDSASRCYWLTALIATEQFDTALQPAIVLWSTTSTSLPECETVFEWLKTQRAWTTQLAEVRIRLALGTNNANFARQLFPLLPADSIPAFERWAQAIENPRKAIDHAIAQPKQSIDPIALLDAWSKLARNDNAAAQTRYLPLVRARSNDNEARRYALELALAMSWNRHPQTLDYFARIKPADLDERGWEWYARSAIWMKRWQRAHQVITAMPATLQQQTRWRYWLARAEEQLGNTSQSQTLFKSLLSDDNYYAALAAARMGQRYAPNPEAIDVNEVLLAKIAAQPAMQRAQELWTINLRDEANDEWRFAFRQLNAEEQVQSVVLASRWGWHEQAILIAAEQKLFDDYQLLYPLPFNSQVQAAAQKTQLPMEFIYGTLRQESLYRRDALSAADARGLMQLLPSTAKLTARKWQLPTPNDLFAPSTNIAIGSAHLRDLVDRYKGQPAVALAAYNAGPAAAARWLPSESMDVDIWIENIPYNETRIYIQRVLWHSVVFGWRISGKAQDTSSWLARVAKD